MDEDLFVPVLRKIGGAGDSKGWMSSGCIETVRRGIGKSRKVDWKGDREHRSGRRCARLLEWRPTRPGGRRLRKLAEVL
jgi:hypothetical protein